MPRSCSPPPASGSAGVADPITAVGRCSIRAFQRLGRAHLFGLQLLRSVGASVRRPRLTVAQMGSVGGRTVVVTALGGLFVGMVLALHGAYGLLRFGAESSLGVRVALPLVRELGPVIAALLFVGRAGSALTAEVGRMKATEQLSALEMMAVDPYRRVFAPRFAAGVVSTPLLTALFTAVGVGGGYLVAVHLLGVDAGSFWSQMQANVGLVADVGKGLLKSVVFGVVATWIALFEGFDAEPTAEGVSRATTRTMVHASLAVLGLNLVVTALMAGQ